MMNSQQVDDIHQQFNWEDCYKTAQNVAFPDVGFICSSHVKRLVLGYCNSIGCPQEYIFLPLLTTCAGLMGNKTRIKVNQTWTEPPILWSVVGARPGTRKTAALKQIMLPLLEIQREQERHWHLSKPSSTESKDTPPKLLAGTMSMSSLCDVLVKNNQTIITFNEDMEYMHRVLELKDNKNKDKIHDLYDGLPLFDIKQGEITSLDSTCFNHTGFARPEYIVNLHFNNPTWLSSRYLVSCPPSPNFLTIWNSNPISSGTLPITSVCQTLHIFHQTPREYTFSEEAWKELTRCHDEEWTSMITQLDRDEKRRGVIEKSLGHIVRIAGVIKSLVNACEYASQSNHTNISNFHWDLVIDRETLCKAIELNKYFVDQKLALMLMTGFGFEVPVYSRNPSFNSREVTQVSHHIRKDVKASLHSKLQPNSVINNFQKQSEGSPSSHTQVNTQRANSNQLPVMNFGVNRIQTRKDVEWIGEVSTLENNDEIDPELIQFAEFAHMEKQQFISVHGKRIKRLLECYDDGNGVSATTASQKSITPPVKLPGTNNRHPVWASALFFQKCAELGVGIADQVKHPTNRKFYWRFKRKAPSSIDETVQQLLNYIKVDMNMYRRMAPRFNSPSISSGSPTCLPKTAGGDINDYHSYTDTNLSMEFDDNIIHNESVVVKREPDEDDTTTSSDSNHGN